MTHYTLVFCFCTFRCLTESSFPLSPLASVATLVNIRNATSYPNPENAAQKPSVFCSKEPQHS